MRFLLPVLTVEYEKISEKASNEDNQSDEMLAEIVI